MLIMDAINELQARIDITDYKDLIPEYYEVLDMAVKALNAQARLCEMLNDFYSEDEEKHEGDSYSRRLVIDMLECISMDYLEEKDEG